jgi:predicted Zn-dependent protease with MMP-like domain
MIDLPSDPLYWQPTQAPSLAEFEMCALAVFRRLPKQFRDLCSDLVVQVDDFASTEVLNALHIRGKYGLLGLFQGIGVPFRSESAPMQMPNMIWLYRRPILAYWAAHDDTLGGIVQHVLIHEIGHHFGFSDADMHAIEHAKS